MYVVVSYDIHDDKRRNRIHKVLKNFGECIQFSVFECDLTKEELLRMQYMLKRIIKEEDQDSVRFYHLCDGCQRKIDRIGGETLPERGRKGLSDIPTAPPPFFLTRQT